jgi:hypothetical protein
MTQKPVSMSDSDSITSPSENGPAVSLYALVRLLARQAAKEALEANTNPAPVPQQTQPPNTGD